jgi:hypothetical protein
MRELRGWRRAISLACAVGEAAGCLGEAARRSCCVYGEDDQHGRAELGNFSYSAISPQLAHKLYKEKEYSEALQK